MYIYEVMLFQGVVFIIIPICIVDVLEILKGFLLCCSLPFVVRFHYFLVTGLYVDPLKLRLLGRLSLFPLCSFGRGLLK